MWPRKKLAAEAGADETGDDFHIFLRDAENLCHDVEVVHNALGALVESELLTIEDCNRGVHLHGVVGLGGGGICVVDFDRSCGEGGFGVASVTEYPWATGCSDRGHGVAEVGGYVEFVRRIRNFDGGSGGLCLGEGLGDGERDVLAPVVDGLVFEGRALLAIAAARGVAEDRVEVAVVKDGEDAGHLLGCGGVDAENFARGDARSDWNGIDHAWEVVIRGIAGRAGGLKGAVDTRKRGANNGGRLGGRSCFMAVRARIVGLDELEVFTEQH